jgi:rubrerythrin
MKTYRNTNSAYGMSGPFEAESREALADEMMPTFERWAKEAYIRDYNDSFRVENEIEAYRAEFIAGLEEVEDEGEIVSRILPRTAAQAKDCGAKS